MKIATVTLVDEDPCGIREISCVFQRELDTAGRSGLATQRYVLLKPTLFIITDHPSQKCWHTLSATIYLYRRVRSFLLMIVPTQVAMRIEVF